MLKRKKHAEGRASCVIARRCQRPAFRRGFHRAFRRAGRSPARRRNVRSTQSARPRPSLRSYQTAAASRTVPPSRSALLHRSGQRRMRSAFQAGCVSSNCYSPGIAPDIAAVNHTSNPRGARHLLPSGHVDRPIPQSNAQPLPGHRHTADRPGSRILYRGLC